MKRPSGFESTTTVPTSPKRERTQRRPTASSAATGSGADSPRRGLPPALAASDPAAHGMGQSSPRRARRMLRAAARARRRGERAEVRRFTRRSRRRRIVLAVLAGVLVILTAAVLVGTYSPLLAVRRIEVLGANRVPTDAVITALSPQLGTPLPLLDFARVRASLAQFPLIQSYVTESRPPDTLVVRIIERRPIALVATSSGFDLVDAAGVTVAASSSRPGGYPLITLPSADRSGTAFAAAAAVLQALPGDLLGRVESISASTTDNVTLRLGSGQRVLWGSAAGSAKKAVNLGLLLQQQPNNATEYDVSSPDVGIIR